MMKTNNRSFCNLMKDKALMLDSLSKNPEFATEEMLQNYSVCYLSSKLARQAEKEGFFEIQDVKYGKFGNIYGFDLKLNVEDADVVLRIYENKFKQEAKLFLGGFFCCSLHCSNGAYLSILKELYSLATNVKVAA